MRARLVQSVVIAGCLFAACGKSGSSTNQSVGSVARSQATPCRATSQRFPGQVLVAALSPDNGGICWVVSADQLSEFRPIAITDQVVVGTTGPCGHQDAAVVALNLAD